MGKKFMFLVAICGMIGSASFAQDDVYFIPSKKVNQVKVQNTQTTYESTSNASSSYSTDADGYYVPSTSTRNVDEYNRRSSVQSVIDDSLKLSTDIEESDMSNYSCTKKIIRFYSPTGVIISSPYYWDICYDNTWDVYYDAWAFGLPCWHYWSYAFNPWYYNRWAYRTCWDFTWGWYDPWWSYSYWGWGRPVYWGWSRPWGAWSYAHYRPLPHYGRGHGFEPGFGHHGGRDFARGNYAGGIHQRPGGFHVNNVRSNGGFASNNRGLSKGFRMDNSQVARSGGFTTNNQNAQSSRRNYATVRGRENNNGSVNPNYGVRNRSNQNGGFQSNRQTQTTPQTRSYEYNRSNSTQSTPSRSYSGGSVGRSAGSFGGSSMGGSRMGGGGVSRGGGGGVARGGGRR